MCQIYVKSNGYHVSSVLISGDQDQIYMNDSVECNEIMAIGRGLSYIKNVLPEVHEVDIFPDKAKPEDICKSEYMKHLNIEVYLGNELNKNEKFDKLCSQRLSTRLRWGDLSAMKEFNNQR